MEVHRDLLAQARHLLTRDRARPKQANLRRAVSAAYYALFHMLLAEASSQVLRGPSHVKDRPLLSRAFTHSTMKAACRAVSSGTLHGFGKQTISKDLDKVCQAYVDLQEMRHTADYDLSTALTKTEARNAVDRADQALKAWKRVRGTRVSRLFLVSLLVHKQLGRR